MRRRFALAVAASLALLAGCATPPVAAPPVGLTDLMVCEILQGVSSDKQAATVLAHLKRFEILDSGGVDVATASAANYRTLRAQGITVRKTIDCLIATVCIQGGHELLHNDRDFDPFEATLGLRVVHG